MRQGTGLRRQKRRRKSPAVRRFSASLFSLLLLFSFKNKGLIPYREIPCAKRRQFSFKGGGNQRR
jgi:hypothetical protein